jgi:cation diffusion facilitator family transporter
MVPHSTHTHSSGPGGHDHGPGSHQHVHGVTDPTVASSARGIWAVKWSFIALILTALLQLALVAVTGSVALLADTIHNIGDAFSAVPLGIAFLLARRAASRRFTYGLGRAEDLAGAFIVLLILVSAVAAAYQSVDRLMHPQELRYLWVVAVAGVIGFLGNEAVAVFRIRVGKQINSAALIADGYHARADGLTSLAVVGSALGVWAGFPIADAIIGLAISAAIAKILWDSSKTVFTRMLDGVDPTVVAELTHEAGHVPGVSGVNDVRARWLGHRLEAELHVAVPAGTSVEAAHRLTVDISHRLSHEFPYLRSAIVHVDPNDAAGADHHKIPAHRHDGLPLHSH